MLSYRHAFHAGNHADVLKHFVLSLVLDYFNQKDKPYWVIDTHAGAGMYALDGEFSQKNAEFKTGIQLLFESNQLPELLTDFVQTIQSFNEKSALDFYPGSPKIAEYFLRAQDKLRLFELHPSDFELLASLFTHQGRQRKIDMQDGFNGIKSCLPPPTKRAITLIDPPYELKEDYVRVVDCLKDSLKRFATGSYLIWYPLLPRPEPLQMIEQLKLLSKDNWLDVTLNVKAPSQDGYGMFGSGMFVVNPPWTMPAQLADTLPTLANLLGLDETAHFTLNSQIS
jgi:23S rRNA (adenine2030-N6)-methyltransferase